MDIQTWLQAKYGLDYSQRGPVEIPNTNRETLARLFYVWQFFTGVELGVERGKYSEVLARENPGVRLFCVDAWKAYKGYRDHVDQEKLDRFYQEATDRLRRFPSVTLVRKFSVDAAKDFADGSLDFVYLDAAHDLCSVVTDLSVWSRKVRPGGIVAGHDYLKAKLPSLMHVPQAIHAWMDAYQLGPLFVLGRNAKVEGELRDDGRSWFYIQPEPVKRSGVIKQ